MSAREIITSDRWPTRLGRWGSQIVTGAGLVGVVGIALSVLIGAASENGRERFYRSYLMAFMFVLSLCQGALFFTMLQHAVKAGWSVVIRRLAEGVAGNLMWIWVLFIPVLIGMYQGHLYDWVHEAAKEDATDKFKYYLNPTFWTIRAAVFLGVWFFLAKFFVGKSIEQDATGEVRLTLRMQRFAPPAFILYAFSQSYAAMDWIMSLSPHWFSTMFPVYFFAASCCGFFSLQIIIMFAVQRRGLLADEITLEHYQDAGKLLFAFGIVFWAYIAFSQYMLIWYANIPEETPWYFARQVGGWGNLSLVLLFGHFLGPFLILISRHPKRRKEMLAAAAGWMLLMHFVDVYWLVMPNVPDAIGAATSYHQLAQDIASNNAIGRGNPGFNPALDVNYGWHLLDLTCVVGLLGLIIAATAKRLSGCSLIPEKDPRLHESLVFENM